MRTDKLTDIFRSKGFYIAFSIFVAILLWTYVAVINNDTMSVEINGAPVIMTGQSELEGREFIATSVNVEKIDLTIAGKPNIVSRLKTRDVTVTVDLSDAARNITSAGVYQLPYTVNYPEGINQAYLTVDSASASYITVKIEKFQTKTIPVRTLSDVVVPDGYQSEPIELKQENLVISGPESDISRISYALVNIETMELTDTYSENLPYNYMSENNEIIETELVRANYETVGVVIPVVVIRDMELNVTFSGSNLIQGVNMEYEISPSSIKVKGSPSRLDSLKTINLGIIDLTSFESEFEDSFEIALPEDIENMSDVTTATVKVRIMGMATRKIVVSDISTIGDSQGYKSRVLTDKLEITLRGLQSHIDAVKASDIVVRADLSDLGAATGTYSVPAKIEVKGNNVDAVGKYTITVQITKE